MPQENEVQATATLQDQVNAELINVSLAMAGDDFSLGESEAALIVAAALAH